MFHENSKAAPFRGSLPFVIFCGYEGDFEPFRNFLNRSETFFANTYVATLILLSSL